MKTTIIQSAAKNAPGWIGRCVERTSIWAGLRGYGYRFAGDELFDFLPRSFGQRPAHAFNRVTMSDYCRLKVIEHLLGEKGDRRVVWVDSDVLVVDCRLTVHLPHEAFACKEVWHDLRFLGCNYYVSKINNAVIGFSCVDRVRRMIAELEETLAESRLTPLIAGPEFLTSTYPDIPLIKEVACLGKHARGRLKAGPKSYCAEIRRMQGSPIYAANLCASSNPQEMDALIDTLLEHRTTLTDEEPATVPGYSPAFGMVGRFVRSRLTRIYAHPKLQSSYQ